MRVLFHTSYSPYHEITGPISAGAEIAMRNIAEGLAARGHEVYYLTFHKDYRHQVHDINGVVVHVMDRKKINGKCGNIFLRFLLYLGWKLHNALPKNIWNNKLRALKARYLHILHRGDGYFWGYKGILNKFIQKYNIELIHCFSSLPDSFASAAVAQKKDVPLVLRMGGRYWYLKYHSLTSGMERNKYFRELYYTFQRTTCLAFNSEVLKKDTIQLLNDLKLPIVEECPVVDIGVEVADTATLDPGYLSHHITKGDYIACVVGKFKENSKRQDLIIRAVAELGDINFKVIFAGDGPKIKEMKDLAHELGVEEQCIFLGPIPRDKVFSLISNVSLFIHPTEFEGSSKAIAEAMLLKKPIIGSNIPALQEHLRHEENAILAENTVGGFVEAIKNLHDDKEKSERLAEAACQYAQEHFDTATNILEYEKLFESLITARRGTVHIPENVTEKNIPSTPSEAKEQMCLMCPNRL